MKAVVIHKALDLRIEEREVETPTAGQVTVAIKRGGICGSDLHYYKHGGFGAIRLLHPMVLGHEVAGEITALGSDVINLKVGQSVAVSPSRPCGLCAYCQLGQQNHCLDMRFYGSAIATLIFTGLSNKALWPMPPNAMWWPMTCQSQKRPLPNPSR